MTRPTMAEVARIAMVSVPTVSRVLSGSPDVAPATREAVLGAAREVGYPLRSKAGDFATGVVDLIIEGAFDPWSMELVIGAEAAAFRGGYTVAISSSAHPGFSFGDWIDARRRRPSLGVVLVLSKPMSDAVRRLQQLDAPVVLIDPAGLGEPQVATIGATNWAGGVSATKHLLALGHRRIGHVGGPQRVQCSRERYEGYLAAHREFGVSHDAALIRSGEFTLDSGRELAAALLGEPDPPTAIFAASDIQAAGVYQAAAAAGLSVPRDLSVVGFDDTNVCRVLAPELTTVRQPLAEMATEALRLIAVARTGEPIGPRRVELATMLIERGSTGTPAKVGRPV